MDGALFLVASFLVAFIFCSGAMEDGSVGLVFTLESKLLISSVEGNVPEVLCCGDSMTGNMEDGC